MRLRLIGEATSARKESGVPEDADSALKTLSYAPQTVQKAAAHALASPRVYNLVVSNIPGPRMPMYLRGCRLHDAYPVVPLSARHALSVGMTTIGDHACFGLYADPETLPDSDRWPATSTTRSTSCVPPLTTHGRHRHHQLRNRRPGSALLASLTPTA